MDLRPMQDFPCCNGARANPERSELAPRICARRLNGGKVAPHLSISLSLSDKLLLLPTEDVSQVSSRLGTLAPRAAAGSYLKNQEFFDSRILLSRFVFTNIVHTSYM